MINEWGSCSDASGTAVILVRWWNGDCDGTGKGGDSNWLDVSKAKILVALNA